MIEKSIIIDFSQQISLSIFIDFRYNQLILSIVIECYRLYRLPRSGLTQNPGWNTTDKKVTTYTPTRASTACNLTILISGDFKIF